MPRLPAIHDANLRALAAELRFAPRPALLNHIGRAETLASVIEPDQSYPPSWIIFRVTAFRPDHADGPPSSGVSLLENLSAFVETLCESANLVSTELSPGAASADDLCSRWGVSRKTLDRARRQGLVGRRVQSGGPARVIMFTPEAVQAYEERAAPAPKSSGRRMSDVTRRTIVRRAARYHDTLGYSINQVARRLGPRYGYSAEAVRSALKKHDERVGDQAIFRELGPPTQREQELAHRALRRGIEPAAIGSRLGRSRTAVWRAANAHRARLLRAIPLDGPVAPTFNRPEASEVLLARVGSASAKSGSMPVHVYDLLEQAAQAPKPDAAYERELALSLHFLRWRAKQQLVDLASPTPEVHALDQIETDLRRASRVKERLMVLTLGSMYATMERRLEQPPQELPPRTLHALCQEMLSGASFAVDRFDPLHGGRLAAPASLAFDRIAVQFIGGQAQEEHQSHRARRTLTPETSSAQLSHAFDPWQRWLEPDPRTSSVIESLKKDHQLILCLRFGLASDWPQTLAAVAEQLNLTHMHAAMRERAAMRAARAAARRTMTP